jgi:hypothetical protein
LNEDIFTPCKEFLYSSNHASTLALVRLLVNVTVIEVSLRLVIITPDVDGFIQYGIVLSSFQRHLYTLQGLWGRLSYMLQQVTGFK